MTDPDTRFAALNELVDTVPAKQLEEELSRQAGGLDGALDVVFAKMASLVDPEKVGSSKGTFQYEVATVGESRPYFLAVDGASTEFGRGTREEADVIIGIKVADLLQMATGKLSGQRAFITGRLKLRGDPMFGIKLGKWLKLS
jgi:putative sterol carrier protein